MSAKYVRLKDRVKEGEELARSNGGKLPSPKILREKHIQLLGAMFRKPEEFANIPRENGVHRTEAQWLEYAEEVRAENGGVLPAQMDLNNSHPSLAGFIHRNKALFATMPRDPWTAKKRARIARYVKQAEDLAAANGGPLKLSREVQRKHNALACAIRQYPEAFAHIPRERRQSQTLAEHVEHAQMLRDTNGGAMPPQTVLKKDFPALRTMMLKHPEAFAHIPVQSLIVTTAQYVELARKLQAEHEGVLPAGAWLRKNGYNNLESTMFRRPEAFKGIVQEVLNARGKRIRTKVL